MPASLRRSMTAWRHSFATRSQSMLEDEVLAEPTRVLAALVATGVLDFKVAVLRSAGDRGNAHLPRQARHPPRRRPATCSCSRAR